MKNYSIYFLKFVTMIVISVLLYIYVVGIDKYFEHLLPHGMTIVGIYLIAWWTVNLMDTTLFFVVGKMKGFTCGMLNFYPIYKSRRKVFCSWNVINVVRLTNTYSLPHISNEELPGISTAKKEAIRMQMISMFCISIVSLIVGIVFSNTFLCIVFFVSMLRYITTRFYNESDYFSQIESTTLVFKELLYTDKIREEVLIHHVTSLLSEVPSFIKRPECLNASILILFICNNNRHVVVEQHLKNLDDSMINLMQHKSDEMDMACRDILFDYFDIRICLHTGETAVVRELLEPLELFITKKWDTKLPEKYPKRYQALRNALKDKENRATLPKHYRIYMS